MLNRLKEDLGEGMIIENFYSYYTFLCRCFFQPHSVFMITVLVKGVSDVDGFQLISPNFGNPINSTFSRVGMPPDLKRKFCVSCRFPSSITIMSSVFSFTCIV